MSDLISRQGAIDAFGLSEKTRKYGGDHSGYNTMMLYEIQDVLESLPSAEPRNKDAISREGLLKSWEELSPRGRTEFDQVIMTIPALPSADRTEPGRWVRSHTGTIGEGFYCSRCGKLGYKTDFCPSCGADMRGKK